MKKQYLLPSILLCAALAATGGSILIKADYVILGVLFIYVLGNLSMWLKIRGGLL